MRFFFSFFRLRIHFSLTLFSKRWFLVSLAFIQLHRTFFLLAQRERGWYLVFISFFFVFFNPVWLIFHYDSLKCTVKRFLINNTGLLSKNLQFYLMRTKKREEKFLREYWNFLCFSSRREKFSKFYWIK